MNRDLQQPAPQDAGARFGASVPTPVLGVRLSSAALDESQCLQVPLTTEKLEKGNVPQNRQSNATLALWV